MYWFGHRWSCSLLVTLPARSVTPQRAYAEYAFLPQMALSDIETPKRVVQMVIFRMKLVSLGYTMTIMVYPAFRHWQMVPSGKRLHNYGKIHHF